MAKDLDIHIQFIIWALIFRHCFCNGDDISFELTMSRTL